MAQAGYTPIQLYYSSTTTNAPTAGNLASGELAINITDGKLFYKDNGGSVQVIAWKTTPTTAGGTGLTSWTAGDLPYYATGTTLSKLGIGTNGQILTSTGTAPQWSTLSGVAVTTFSAGTTGFTPSTATSGAVTLAGTLAVANGGTGTSTTFTAGSVVFAGASGVYSQNNSNFFWDNSNNRLGLGVTAPTRLLHLDGGGSTTYLQMTNTASGRTDADGFQIAQDAANVEIILRENGYMTFFTNNTERARITAAGLFGLGVASPQAMFDLAGDYKEGVVTANTGTAYTINTANGTLQILTLTGNCTFTFPTAIAGESFTLLLRQDGTGGRTVTWPAAVRWPGGTAPTITSTASQTDKYIFTSDGTRWYGSNAGQAYAA